MKITCNGRELQIKEHASVEDLVAELGLKDQPCAVEVNKELVPKRKHGQTGLREGDCVEVVTLVGGG